MKYGDNSYSRWIVDPLDGSLNFSRNIPINCISIGLWNNNKPIFGVIYNFLNDDIYIGEVGVGSTLNGNNITVSSIDQLAKSILCTGFPVYSSFDTNTLTDFVINIQKYKKIRLLGSAALSLCFVARGSVEGYQENDIAIWDVAAGIALVLAAGGKVDFSFGNKENLLNVFASNGLIG